MALADLGTEFVGRRGRLFRMAFLMGGLTVLTLGIYRFWMKTRLRRYYWSSIRPGGHPLEYVGDPLEKLLGFFIAVVILAFYIGIVNLILMFVSFSLFDGNTAAYVASVAGVVPLWFYARYRARRYVLARTRWRGIRFGVDPGAWGYAGRALVHWVITVLSLGLLWPRMTFWLEKYRWDRTWFGDRRFRQGGRWPMLYAGWVPVWLTAVAPVAAIWVSGGDTDTVLGAVLIALPILGIALAWYSVRSFRLLTNHKTAGAIGFESRARTPRVVGIYLLGYAITGLLTAVAAGVAAFSVVAVAAGVEESAPLLEGLDSFEPGMPSTGAQVLGIAFYFLVFVAWTAFRHVFVTLPLWRHYAETIGIRGTESLPDVRQRLRDEHREAEGFAEALDLGAAI